MRIAVQSNGVFKLLVTHLLKTQKDLDTRSEAKF